MVHGEDKSEMRRITLGGKAYDVTGAEALIYWYLHDENSRINVALSDTAIIGFVIYNPILEGVVAIRLAFVAPEHSGRGIGRDLIASIEGVRTLIFQTKINIPPKVLFAMTNGRETKIDETEYCSTWLMKWGDSKGGRYK